MVVFKVGACISLFCFLVVERAAPGAISGVRIVPYNLVLTFLNCEMASAVGSRAYQYAGGGQGCAILLAAR